VSNTVLHNRAIERQNKAWKAMQEVKQCATAEQRDMSGEERKAWDAAEVELEEASGDIERFEREAKLNKVDRSEVIATADGGERDTTDAEKRYAEAFEAYARRGMRGLNGEQRDMLQQGFSEIRAAAGTTPDTAGGYLVPEGWRGTLTETLKAFGGILNDAEVISTSSGQDLPWPTNDDTSNVGEIIGENTQVSEQDLTFGGKKLGAYIFSSKAIRVSLALLQDTGINLEQFIPRKQGERIGRRLAQTLATGTGVDQPQGITVGISTGKTGASGQTASIIYADLIDLEHSVDPAYRMSAKYIFHDSTLKVLRKLVDGDSRPIWVPVPAQGFPATINGWAYTVDNSMPEMAASAKSVVFGNISAGYIVREVRGVQNLRLTERYADYLQVGFIGFARYDAMIQDTSAIKAYVNAAS
jgi:HK97 family phage major capsid protein